MSRRNGKNGISSGRLSGLGGQTILGCGELESRLAPTGGLSVRAPLDTGYYAVGSGTGVVAVYRSDGTEALRGEPYGFGLRADIRVALADVTGDQIPDLITAPGPGGAPDVRIFNGNTGDLIGSFEAYESSFFGGVYVGAGDLNGDGRAEVVVSPDRGGGPRIRVLDGATLAPGGQPRVLNDFLGLDDPSFRGGVRLALGDLNSDHVADLLVGAGFSGGPRVTAYDGTALSQGDEVKVFNDFFAFEPGLRNGVYVAVDDVNGDGCGDLIFGAGPGGAPRVIAIDLRAVTDGGGFARLAEIPHAYLADFFAGDLGSREGVRVGSLPAGAGSGAIVAADVATSTLAVFNSDGSVRQSLNLPEGATGVYFASVTSETLFTAPISEGETPALSGGAPFAGGSTGEGSGGSSSGGGSSGGDLGTGAGSSSGGGSSSGSGGSSSSGGGGSTGTRARTFPSSRFFQATSTYYQDVSGNENSLATAVNPFAYSYWFFDLDDHVFWAADASQNTLCFGVWSRNPNGSISFHSDQTRYYGTNRYDFSGGVAEVASDGSYLISGSFTSNASLFSFEYGLFGQFALVVRPL